jgi:hypothetical protein
VRIKWSRRCGNLLALFKNLWNNGRYSKYSHSEVQGWESPTKALGTALFNPVAITTLSSSTEYVATGTG